MLLTFGGVVVLSMNAVEAQPGPMTFVVSLAASSDSRYLASATNTRELTVYRADTGVRIWKGISEHFFHSVEFSPDSRLLLSIYPRSDRSPTLEAWEVSTGKRRLRINGLVKNPYCGSIAPDGTQIAIGSTDGIVVFAVADGREIHRLDTRVWMTFSDNKRVAFSSPVHTLAFSPKSDAVAILAPKKVKLWNPKSDSQSELLAIKEYYGPIRFLTFSPDGKLLALVGRMVGVLDVATGETKFQQEPEHYCSRVSFSPNGKLLVVNSLPLAVYLWDITSGKELWKRDLPGPAAFTAQGKVLAISDYPNLLLLDLAKEGIPADLLEPPKSRPMPRKEQAGPLLRLDNQELEELWRHLAGDDGEQAHKAIYRLAASADTVPFLRERLKPVPRHLDEKIQRLLTELDADRAVIRHRAAAELETMAEAAQGTLQVALQGKPSPEVRRCLEAILDRVRGPIRDPGVVQAVRAVEALEKLGTAEAQQLLKELAQGASGAHQTRDAIDALRRLTGG
jgi:outer membrane protein assembly factor BamB